MIVVQRRQHSSRSESAMDHERFDAVARAVSRGCSRRYALRLLIGGSFVGWLAGGRLTVHAKQSCDSGLTYCSGNCVDLSSDYLNCGACGFACPSAGPDVATIECIGGTCVQTACDPGYANCAGGLECTDLSQDSGNCGTCGNVCQSGVCSSGSCTGAVAADDSTAAGSGGNATANANGGAVVIGDVDSGGNVGNVISVGDTYGPVWVDGGDVSNSTTIDITADGGTAIADAGGGSGNVAVD
jgi:hypothetical protein